MKLGLLVASENAKRQTFRHTRFMFYKYKISIFVLPVLLQHGADPNIRNTDGKTALDLADPTAKAVLAGQCKSYVSFLKNFF